MTLEHLVLWRHGETDFNAADRMQGQLDISRLTAAGEEQVHRAAPVLAALRPDVLVTSDLTRAVATAAILAEQVGLDARLDKRLRETNVGVWQGLTRAEVDARWPGGIAHWRESPWWAPQDGETRVEVAARASQVVDELDAAGHHSALLCTHGGLISGLTPSLLGLAPATWPGFPAIGNCHWVQLHRRGDRWRLAAYNTAAVTHLR